MGRSGPSGPSEGARSRLADWEYHDQIDDVERAVKADNGLLTVAIRIFAILQARA